jgi:hypothetical protein
LEFLQVGLILGTMSSHAIDYQRQGDQQTQNLSSPPAVSQSIHNLPDHVKAQAVQAAHPASSMMDRATQHRAQSHESGSNQADGKEALRHNQSSHGKSQEAMSPTDSHKGNTQTQSRPQRRGRGIER